MRAGKGDDNRAEVNDKPGRVVKWRCTHAPLLGCLCFHDNGALLSGGDNKGAEDEGAHPHAHSATQANERPRQRHHRDTG